MSLPRLDWMRMDSSGPMKILCPSMWEAKVTPSSVMLRKPGQGEHLEAAGVGEHGPVPAHELVQAAHGLHRLIPGAQVEVVGVGQLHLAADLLQIQGGHRPLMAPWVPTFMNTGVCTVPWGQVNTPRRAFPSVLIS